MCTYSVCFEGRVCCGVSKFSRYGPPLPVADGLLLSYVFRHIFSAVSESSKILSAPSAVSPPFKSPSATRILCIAVVVINYGNIGVSGRHQEGGCGSCRRRSR